MTRRVLVDANIFYSKVLTDWLFFIHAYMDTSFTLICTEDILAETRYHLRKRYPSASSATVNHRISKIKMCIDELVEFQGHNTGVPDVGDLHVHAAAVDGQVDVLLTHNTKDFPPPRHYEVLTPDIFFMEVATDAQNTNQLTEIIKLQVDYMRQKGKSHRLDIYLERAGCPNFSRYIHNLMGKIGYYE